MFGMPMVYVNDEESKLKRPAQELKAFKKVDLAVGASAAIELKLNADAFQYYDDTQKKWVLESGKCTVKVGSSSRDIRLEEEVEF